MYRKGWGEGGGGVGGLRSYEEPQPAHRGGGVGKKVFFFSFFSFFFVRVIFQADPLKEGSDWRIREIHKKSDRNVWKFYG